MKKILAKIFGVVLLVCLSLAMLTGCAEGKWSGKVTMKNGGAVLSNGGFIAETDEYLYFINGVGGTYSENKMGEPLKGALLVADKNDLSKTEVVVPKLMVANDYNAGVFIDGGYAYYGTPSVDKDSSGSVANYKMTFMRTKLDGSGKTDEFFTHKEFVSEYRIVKGPQENSPVYIYYYDANKTAIVCYNTSTKKATTVVKTDDTAQESLNEYMFIKNSEIKDIVGFCTVTVYEDEYDDKVAENPSYSRITAGYNKVYAIMAGSTELVPVVDGMGDVDISSDDITYSLKLLDDGLLFFTTTNKGVIKAFVITQANATKVEEDDGNIVIGGAWDTAKEVVNTDYINKSTLFVIPASGNVEEVVAYVSGESKVYKTTLFAKDNMTKEPIVAKDVVGEMLFIRAENGGEYLYYFDTGAQLMKLNLADAEKQIRISESTVSTTWYDPEIIEIDGKEYMFYCDDSNYGKSYIKYVDIDTQATGEDTDDDDVEDKFYFALEEIKDFGKKTVKDQADILSSKMIAVSNYLPSGGIGFDEEADAELMEEYLKAKALYEDENLSSKVKDKVSDQAIETLEKIEKAFGIAEKYKQLEGIRYIVSADDEGADEVKAIYETIKEDLKKFKDSDDRDKIDELIHNELKSHYTKVIQIFEETEKDKD